MRCTHCDLPLSPTSTARVCPRCHMPTTTSATGANAVAKSKHPPVVQSPSWGESADSLGWQGNSGPFVGVPPNSGSWNTNFSGTQSSGQLPFPAPQQTPYPQPGQMWLPTSPTPSTLTPASMSAPLPTFSSPQLSAREIRWESRPLPQTPETHMPKTRTGTSNLGFLIAGACVITGGLLLILVYFIAAALPPSVVQMQSITAARPAVPATQHSTPTAVAPTPTRKATPPASTGAFPAQQYITNPQMASAVNMTTAQVTQPATTFRVGQRVFVTFVIHPAGHSGAVCLLWYSNAKSFSHFEFAVSSNSTVAYSYTYYAAVGPAYVEIYWASDISCSDKMLAQRVNFTVAN